MTDVIERPAGSCWRDSTDLYKDRVYVIDDRPCDWLGLVPAKLNGRRVLLREEDFGRRLHPA